MLICPRFVEQLSHSSTPRKLEVRLGLTVIESSPVKLLILKGIPLISMQISQEDLVEKKLRISVDSADGKVGHFFTLQGSSWKKHSSLPPAVDV